MDISYDCDTALASAAPRARAISAARALARIAAYPTLVVAMVVVGVAALRYGWNLGAVNFAFLVGSLTYFAILERLIPYEPAWHPSLREWRWYGTYFLLTVLGGGLAQLPIMALVGVVAVPQGWLPLWAELPFAVLLGSLASYVMHRLGHTNAWLWRLHGVHHVPDKVNVGNNGVNHIFDIVLAQGAVQLALAFAGFSEPAVFAIGLFVIVQGYFIHANIDVRIGWLNHVFSSPEQHRLHHSTDLAEAGNFGSDLSIWDQLFGTFTWRSGRRPAAVGLHDPKSFPPTGEIVASLLHPWRSRAGARGARG
ncbi:sterol desaturase family protein [Micromonospora sp. WMMD956]|uniref:sterol desaturase family protein n=1 Tax=Micromonospora TaxID=1873 RepID=UPI002417CE09|nr:sterol desaturase family protein [Micromonospora sp. WMMD956]MDG4814823.1 sterol desaturase family protein [Micromonospora sp. WMMD956]